MKYQLIKPQERFFSFRSLLTEVQTHFGVAALISRFYWPVIVLQEETIILAEIPEGKLVFEKIQETKGYLYQLSLNSSLLWEQRQKGRKLSDPVLYTEITCANGRLVT